MRDEGGDSGEGGKEEERGSLPQSEQANLGFSRTHGTELLNTSRVMGHI